jgi:hypothetical protein
MSAAQISTSGKPATHRLWRVETDEPWLVGVLDVGDRNYLMSVTWHGGFQDPPAGYTHLVRVNVQIKQQNASGFSAEQETDHLLDMNRAFVLAAQSRAVPVGSLTHNGTITFCYYAREITWIPEFETALRAREEHPFRITVEQDPEWSYYLVVLDEAEQADSDRQVLANLENFGADLTRVRETDWFFYFRTEDAARTAATLLSEHGDGFQILPPDPAESAEWCLIVTQKTALSKGYVARMTSQFVRFAKEQGGIYDGWGAEIFPDEAGAHPPE